MKLAENEERALKALRDNLYNRYPILDFRLFGSKARGEGRQDSDLDVMLEIPDYDRRTVEQIDDLIYKINLEFDVFISALFLGRMKLNKADVRSADIQVIQREGFRYDHRRQEKGPGPIPIATSPRESGRSPLSFQRR